MGDNETDTEQQTTPQGSVTRLPKGALAPEPKQRGKRSPAQQTKTSKTPATQRGRRTGTAKVATLKRPYTRRVQVALSPSSRINRLLKANGFTDAVILTATEGRRRLVIPLDDTI